jgi:hypothetical protein
MDLRETYHENINWSETGLGSGVVVKMFVMLNLQVKVEISLLQAIEAHRVLRG